MKLEVVEEGEDGRVFSAHKPADLKRPQSFVRDINAMQRYDMEVSK